MELYLRSQSNLASQPGRPQPQLYLSFERIIDMDAAESNLVGSLFLNFPPLANMEARFDIGKARKWMGSTMYIPWGGAALYLVSLYLGRMWMSNRRPYNLKNSVFIWNFTLAVFSFFGCISTFPHLVHHIISNGFVYTTCNTEIFAHHPRIVLWGFIFCLSKLMELGDTVFIVLRKSKLSFLHWYHHVTVLLFAYYAFGRPTESALELYFSSINYFVHTIMYTYYALKAANVRVPSVIAQFITILQILQMFVCMIATIMAYITSRNGAQCQLHTGVFYAGMTIYASYALLFVKFFISRYF